MRPSLDSLAKTAEIVGAFAVVLSLIYVGYQVQQNTKAIQTQVHQSLVANVFEAEGIVLANPNLARIILKSHSNPASLTAEEQLLSDTYFTFSFVNWESAYLHYDQGFVAERVWQAWDRSNYPDGNAQGYFDFWLQHRDWYDSSFAHHVDSIYRDRGYTSTDPDNLTHPQND